MSDDVFAWEEPPPAPPRRYSVGTTDGDKVRAKLEERPGEWARIRVYDRDADLNRTRATSYAWMVRKGKQAWARPAGAIEAVVRPLGDDGNWAVYARYLGGDAS